MKVNIKGVDLNLDDGIVNYLKETHNIDAINVLTLVIKEEQEDEFFDYDLHAGVPHC